MSDEQEDTGRLYELVGTAEAEVIKASEVNEE